MAVLYCADMSVGKLDNILSEIKWSSDSLMLAFTPAEWRFEPYRVDSAFLAATSDGRIFSPTGELRWRRFKDGFRVVYLGETVPAANLEDFSPELENLVPSLGQLLLWGVRSDLEHEWLEQQVPQRFSYPLSSGEIPRGRVALVVEEWKDSCGRPLFGRYHSIKEVPGGSHAD